MLFEKYFFEKETRCGFEVPVMMKRAWAAELEVFQVVSDICRKNGIRYYASSGTLLGAVRHKGFIPWDDDIDLCMKREDYQRLINILPAQLPDGFCMHGIHASVHDGERTTVDSLFHVVVTADRHLWDMNEYIQYFHGYPFHAVGIDIFPLDYVPRDRGMFEGQLYIVDFAQALVKEWDELDRCGQLEYSLGEFERASGIRIPLEDYEYHLWNAVDRVASLCHEEEGDALVDYPFYHTMRGELKKEWYDDVVWLPFENTEVAVPVRYGEALTAYFGDYMEPVRGASLHDTYPFYEEMEQQLAIDLQQAGLSCSAEEFGEQVLDGKITVNWG